MVDGPSTGGSGGAGGYGGHGHHRRTSSHDLNFGLSDLDPPGLGSSGHSAGSSDVWDADTSFDMNDSLPEVRVGACAMGVRRVAVCVCVCACCGGRFQFVNGWRVLMICARVCVPGRRDVTDAVCRWRI